MPEEQRNTLRYRVLRYTPNIVRDEWVNIGVLLEEAEGSRRAMRLIEEPSEIARVRRLQPGADEELLRALPSEFDARLQAPETKVQIYLENLDQTLSNVLQFSPQKGLLSENFDTELDRLFRDHVAAPPTTRTGILENTRAWIRARLNDVFRRHRILGKPERSIGVEEFTQPGDPLQLGRDPAQAKVLAYTAEGIRARTPNSEFTAITEVEFAAANPWHQFVARLFEEQHISVVPLSRIEKFAEGLQARLQ
jgi:hypothetical protein